MRLHYPASAARWTEALPLGNGRMGAMVFGGAREEHLQLNEDTLWSGYPRPVFIPEDATGILAQVRELVQQGQYAEADECCKSLMGPYTESYLPLGDLHLHFDHEEEVTQYERSLDLETAVAQVQYTCSGVTYQRAMFLSYPDNTLIIRLTASRANALSFSVFLTSDLMSQTHCDQQKVTLLGYCPERVYPNYVLTEEPIVYGDPQSTKAIRFVGKVQVLKEDGHVSVQGDKLRITGSTAVTLLFSVATSFREYNQLPDLALEVVEAQVTKVLDRAAQRSYDELLQRHIDDYQQLFARVKFHLELSNSSTLQTNVPTPRLIEMMFQYGRYLLIASSRQGTQPANLQGIWNHELRAPWSSNYTLNINTPMNYWLAEPCNLPECHEPLFSMIGELAEQGQQTAKDLYGCRGFTVHHNSDLWRQTLPTGGFGHGDASWAMWPMGGVWLSQHVWEHYAFTLDEVFLRETAYPIMRSAAQFCLDWLIADEDGHLVTTPSTSPENLFLGDHGQVAAVSKGSTMDMSLIWELFTNCIDALTVLQTDFLFLHKMKAICDRLLPPQIGRYGQLQEWMHDWDEQDVHHRHVSHLFGVFPGHQWTHDNDPEVYLAAKKSLQRRGNGGTGWSLAWKIGLWARLGDGEQAVALIKRWH